MGSNCKNGMQLVVVIRGGMQLNECVSCNRLRLIPHSLKEIFLSALVR
jgi:hypothetical protein